MWKHREDQDPRLLEEVGDLIYRILVPSIFQDIKKLKKLNFEKNSFFGVQPR